MIRKCLLALTMLASQYHPALGQRGPTDSKPIKRALDDARDVLKSLGPTATPAWTCARLAVLHDEIEVIGDPAGEVEARLQSATAELAAAGVAYCGLSNDADAKRVDVPARLGRVRDDLAWADGRAIGAVDFAKTVRADWVALTIGLEKRLAREFRAGRGQTWTEPTRRTDLRRACYEMGHVTATTEILRTTRSSRTPPTIYDRGCDAQIAKLRDAWANITHNFCAPETLRFQRLDAYPEIDRGEISAVMIDAVDGASRLMGELGPSCLQK